MKPLDMVGWDALSLQEQERVARQVNAVLPAAFTPLGLRRFRCGMTAHCVAQWRWQNPTPEDGREDSVFSLVPGGTVELGFDFSVMGRFPPAMHAEWESRSEDFRVEGSDARSLEEQIAATCSQLRRVTLPPLLIEEDARELKAPLAPDSEEVSAALAALRHSNGGAEASRWTLNEPTLRVDVEQGSAARAWRLLHPTRQELAQSLARDGFRMLSSDEWEHACAAGARTLFRWGDVCPLTYTPEVDRVRDRYEEHALINAAPNAWGLKIANYSHRMEEVEEVGIARGGDGGCASCFGSGLVAQWLPLASSYVWSDYDKLQASSGTEARLWGLIRRAFPVMEISD